MATILMVVYSYNLRSAWQYELRARGTNPFIFKASLSALHPLPTDRYESQHIHCPLLKKVTLQYDFDAEQIGEISVKGNCVSVNFRPLNGFDLNLLN